MRRFGVPLAAAALSLVWLATLFSTGRPGMHGVVHVGSTPSPSPSSSGSPSPSASPSPSGSPSPSPSPTGPNAFTIAVVPAVAVWGTTFSISGSLTCFGTPVVGAGITVQKRNGGSSSFDTIGTTTTGASGGYSVAHRPDRSADYRALVLSGTGACGLSTSAIARGAVRPGVAANVTTPRVQRGGAAEFRGAVSPGHAGLRVYLQVFQGRTGTWANSTVAALDSSSRYRLTYRRASPGFLLFRVVFPTQDRDHTWNISRNLRVDWT